MAKPKRRVVVRVIPLLIGLRGFYPVAQGPHFELYRTVDFAQLLVSGAGFGGALVGFMLGPVLPRA